MDARTPPRPGSSSDPYEEHGGDLHNGVPRGREPSLSDAMQAVEEMGYNWSTVRGSDYWSHGGAKLSAMTPAIE
ncbi:hypothetical protein D3C77_237160 [compost metagenome]